PSTTLHTLLPFFFHCFRAHRSLHSFPTRRSSDLTSGESGFPSSIIPDNTYNTICRDFTFTNVKCFWFIFVGKAKVIKFHLFSGRDRKSTRLNSSHVSISYAVFCLKKKTQK